MGGEYNMFLLCKKEKILKCYYKSKLSESFCFQMAACEGQFHSICEVRHKHKHKQYIYKSELNSFFIQI